MNPEEHSLIAPEPSTARERLLWRIWLAIVAFLVIGSLVWTALLMLFWQPPPVRHRVHPEWEAAYAFTPAPFAASTPTAAAAPGSSTRFPADAGPGIVWVNTKSHIYHFPGYRWYGTTINGKYTSEREAVAEGDRSARNERRPVDLGAWVRQ